MVQSPQESSVACVSYQLSTRGQQSPRFHPQTMYVFISDPGGTCWGGGGLGHFGQGFQQQFFKTPYSVWK